MKQLFSENIHYMSLQFKAIPRYIVMKFKMHQLSLVHYQLFAINSPPDNP